MCTPRCLATAPVRSTGPAACAGPGPVEAAWCRWDAVGCQAMWLYGEDVPLESGEADGLRVAKGACQSPVPG
ncbi:hypothetical protein JCM12681A_34420 [Streptomyces mexicanus]